jgi:lipopolysaccharide/colanic/teichoic acid biosynthesis glycosyltransferase
MAQVQTFDNEKLPARRDSVQASPWNQSDGKRIFDLAAASLMLMAASPLMLLVAAIVKCTSRGPVVFRQTRVGQDGRLFQILKFRTMTHDRSNPGVKLTRGGDKRVTIAGRLLRKLKLLPQLFSFIRGDMPRLGLDRTCRNSVPHSAASNAKSYV